MRKKEKLRKLVKKLDQLVKQAKENYERETRNNKKNP